MTVWAIADLHLSAGDKPMDVFGAQWTNHFARIEADWRARVAEDDIVLLPGDLSWAMQLADAKPHLEAVGCLPGRKVLLKGNHDYWWSAIGRVREALPLGMYAIQNDALAIDGASFCGTRGWVLPDADTPREDVRVYERELLRLQMSLKAAARLGEPLACVLMHYPPLTRGHMDTGFTQILRAYGARRVVYGHLHGESVRGAVSGVVDGIDYRCVSCDALSFRLCRLDGDE